MRVILLTQVVPYPPDSGPKIKTYHVLRYLAESGHRVTLVSFVRKEEKPNLEQLKPFCDAIHAIPMRRTRLNDVAAYAHSLRFGLPFLVTRDAKREMYALVSRLVRDQSFDIIHADQLTMAQFAFQRPTFQRSNVQNSTAPHRVFDAHNAVWQIVERSKQTAPVFLRPIIAREARLLKKYEGALCNAMDTTLAVSENDRQTLAEAGADTSRITVIPIAVDCKALQPVRRTADSLNILTMGTLYYPPNAEGVRWFMNQVFPLVRQQIPEATLTIVGPRPPKDILQYAIRHTPSVTVTGYVPDLQPYLEQAAVMVVPVLAASGMRVRILEALARGVPVVTTTTGVEGIDAVNERHLLVADQPEAFAAAVVRILENPELGRDLAENGRRLVEEKYDWQAVLPKLESVYTSLAQQK